ncbi:mannitol dehydrogenase family protein [Anaerosporobacter faecicola]|uniref:mannitol dehydrogenase family protein n=1 Tax=Anaerosporobacter faecicola TaxID=2718714 RepID=UPI00143B1505|nr:mannitol dehydrogenase family protein [Anaerosporobacter faecicola]
MKLSEEGLREVEQWRKAGYQLWSYNRELVKRKTKENPYWLHFGAGNLFRAFQANVVQNRLNEGILDRGLIVAEGYDYEIIEKIYEKQDNLSILVTLKKDGSMEKTVIGSIVESLVLKEHKESDWIRLQEIFCAPGLQMVSFTITEKGYALKNGDGNWFPSVKEDLMNGPSNPKSYMGKITALLYNRYTHGGYPIAMVSMDNCSHNGEKLYQTVSTIAVQWRERGLVEEGFCTYISDTKRVGFPCTMIDKITPRPNDEVKKQLEKDQMEELEPIVTKKNTYIAPYVNAEECQYLIMEDVFPNGRPEIEGEHVWFARREVVDRVEKMKVCTCLNPLHTALAIFGCLLGYTRIAKEMEDPVLRKLVDQIGYQEGLPVVMDPEILSPRQFIDEVIKVRIPNPYLPDTPQRIATDTSQKLSIRFGETVKAYAESETRNVDELIGIPIVFAGWLRYLMALNDHGERFTVSSDPLYSELKPYLEKITLGQKKEVVSCIQPILEREDIFGVNLYTIGLGNRVERFFLEMIAGTGAVRTTLENYLL